MSLAVFDKLVIGSDGARKHRARYREVLATDRSHMLDASGHYRVPPPPWPAIGTGTNLMRLVDLDDPIAGEIVALSELPAALARLEPAA